ncbi:MAG: hypothetical protein OXC62_15570 [Aestuariivita sp.]|nr:hypothetical protein [Aestuariivita sp.]
MSHRALSNRVMARLAHPDSESSTVRVLANDFGVSIALEKVYRMMDHLYGAAISHMRERIAATMRSLLPAPIDLVLLDWTTLFFPSPCEDTLRAFGYRQNGQHGDVPVLLALAVTRSG